MLHIENTVANTMKPPYTIRVRTGHGKPGKSCAIYDFNFQAWKVIEF